MNSPPPPYSEKAPVFFSDDPPSYTENDIQDLEELLLRKLSKKSRRYSPPPPATPPTSPSPPPTLKTKRDRWWMVCPPTFGRTPMECAVWHMYILVGIACVFLWLSVAVPNYLEVNNVKGVDTPLVSKFLLGFGVFILPFALFGSVGLKYSIHYFLAAPASIYSVWMICGVISIFAWFFMLMNSIFWAEVEYAGYSLAALLVSVLAFWYFSHGYRIMMRCSNDMKDDYLDAHPEKIEVFESEVTEVETLSDSE